MQELNQSLILALVLVPTLFGVFRLPKEMAIAVVAISLALSFNNLDKFTKFKAAVSKPSFGLLLIRLMQPSINSSSWAFA